MRLIALDTETTGASAQRGDRCVDIGLVEILDGRVTGRVYQTYLNPGRPVDWRARRVHGLSDAFLADKPGFESIAGDLLDFIQDSPVLAHNARFDRDMLLHDFRASRLEIPRLTFFDTLPFAKSALPGQRSYKLDVLAASLLGIGKPRGLHGALQDAEILAECVCALELRRPGLASSWFRPANAISSLPKGWTSFESPHIKPAPVLMDEREEVGRIVSCVRDALKRSASLADFSENLLSSGIYLRPVINRDMALHGVRFSTPLASFAGGEMGLTGSILRDCGITYKHPEDQNLAQRLVLEHDRVMGSITSVKERFTAKPKDERGPQNAHARERLRTIVLQELERSPTIWHLIGNLEPHGILFETRLDVKRMVVGSTLFSMEGARLPGSAMGLSRKDMTERFWSLEYPGGLPSKHPGAIHAASQVEKIRARTPSDIGECLNDGVPDIVRWVNDLDRDIRTDDITNIRSGRDGWSAMSAPDMIEILEPVHGIDTVMSNVSDLPDPDMLSALRWMCRGLSPEKSREFHIVRAAHYEERNAARFGPEM